VRGFYGKDGQGGINNTSAHRYVDKLVQAWCATARQSTAPLRVAYVGCGLMKLSPHDKITVHYDYYDVTKYGRRDVIAQSLDGDEPLEGGRYHYIVVAQASGTLLCATAAARMLVDVRDGRHGIRRAREDERAAGEQHGCWWTRCSPAAHGGVAK